MPIYLDEIYKIQQKDSDGSYRNESQVELEKLVRKILNFIDSH